MKNTILAGVLAVAASELALPASANVIADQSQLASYTVELPWSQPRVKHPDRL